MHLVAGWQVNTEVIGSCAAVLTTVAYAPQVIRTWRRGGAGLSWLMIAMLGAGVWLWFVYGVLRNSVPIVAANGVTGLQLAFLAGLKAWHERKPDEARRDSRDSPNQANAEASSS
jgi:MtN3 and saliva related transmembrane protein